MISFRYRSNQKKIKIKTNKKLDERMSTWLQKVFNIKNQIIGFKSADNKYYDVQTFFHLIDKFYNSQVQIVEGNDQVQISFTSDNLNSSSFIRPSQPNTSQINHRGASSEQDQVCFVSDFKAFQKKLNEKDISVLFDIHSGYKKEVVENLGDFNHTFAGGKVILYLLINNNHPKKSNFTIYIGKKFLITVPLTTQFKEIISNVISRSKASNLANYEPSRAVKAQVEDQAPSFTTYHLQQRLNQDACFDYLERMNRQKMLTSYQHQKLVEKLEDNFNQFYKLFCEGVVQAQNNTRDNDYESFKNQIRAKVENNLEMLLSNVEEMDLSRPISREQQRRQNLKKFTPDIEIVKVEKYFEVLDLIKDKLDQKYLGEIKQNLLDENQELCNYFSKFIARDYGKEELTKKLTTFAKQRFEDLRPFSRCVPRATNRAKSTDAAARKGELQIDTRQKRQFDNRNNEIFQEAPMFGSLNIQSQNIVSPIKNMSDIESIYKKAFEGLAKKTQKFTAEQYGLLYHYLQTKNDGILNIIQSLQNYEDNSLMKLKEFLKQKMQNILSQNFSENEIFYLQSLKNNSNVSYIYENFKYECDINSFVNALRDQLNKGKPQFERILHKKSSDSQLLDKMTKPKQQKRKYSDQNEEEHKNFPSPKASDISLFHKGSDFSLYNLKLLSNPWSEQFQEMLNYCQFNQSHKQQYLRSAYSEINPSLFLWVREYLKNKESKQHDAEFFRQNIQKKEYESRGIMKILPIYSELLRQLENEGRITQKMRKWAVFKFMEVELNLLGSFQLYLLTKDQQQFVESLKMVFEKDNKEMELYKTFTNRIYVLLREICVHDLASLEIFNYQTAKINSFIDVYYFNGDFQDLMENLDLLRTNYILKQKVNVATLNFSGINTNPFEYDDGSDLFKKINENIKELTLKQFPNIVDWQVGKIDKNYRGFQRLSVGCNPRIESINGKLFNKQEFHTLWREKYNLWRVNNPKYDSPQEAIQTNIAMDYIFYYSLLKQVYKAATFEQLQQNLKTYQANNLNEFLKKQFNRPASKLNIKEDLVIQYLLHQKIDLLCLQQAGFIDWKEQLIPGYAQHKNHDSVLIYKKQKFGTIRQPLMQKYGKDLDFNEDTSFLFTSKNYLIISAHLKSKKIHYEQAKSMFATLRQIKEEHPYMKILVGMDANHFLVHQNLLDAEGKQIFFIAPDVPQKPTTIKQRSFMQAQFKKAGLAVSEVKDHIVTSKKLQEYSIQEINGKQSEQRLVPNDDHPYDHYVVRASVSFL